LIAAAVIGSSPVVGSSKNNRRGEATIARARPPRFFFVDAPELEGRRLSHPAVGRSEQPPAAAR